MDHRELTNVADAQPVQLDDINQDVGRHIQSEFISKDQVSDLIRKIAADQAPEASDALEKVAADGGIEAHAVKGDPSKCPFLMGKISVMQHVEVGEIQPASEGRSVREIREERRRLRAQTKEVPTESVKPIPAEQTVIMNGGSDLKPSLEHIIREAHIETVFMPQPLERKRGVIVDTPVSLQELSAVKSEAKVNVTVTLKDKIYQRTEVVRAEPKNAPKAVESIIRQPPEESVNIEEPIIEVSPVPTAREHKHAFTELLDNVNHIVDTASVVTSPNEELLSVAPETAAESSTHTPLPNEVARASSQNIPLTAGFDREMTISAVRPEIQERAEHPTYLEEVILPHLADDTVEKAAVMQIVRVLNEKISEVIDTGNLISHEAEIAKTVEQLVQKFPEELRAELRTVISARIQEIAADTKIYSDQREMFNMLGTHEFKFFHYKSQSQLQIKEKASRYLLTLLSKNYVLT